MKILYVGSNRNDARATATALRGVAKDLAFSWASQPDDAERWIDENRDVGAVVAEARTDSGNGRSVVKHVRSLGLPAPVVVIVPEGADFHLGSLEAQADEYIARNDSLLSDLPVVVTRAINCARIRAPLKAEHKGRLTAVSVPLSALPQTLPESQDGTDRTERAKASCEATAAQHLARLEALVHQERAARADLEQRHLSATATLAAELADRRAEYEIGMARAAAKWEMVDEQLREAAIEVEKARQGQASAVADVDRLTRRESDLSSRLAGLTETHHSCERRLADAEAALHVANERLARERFDATEQLAERQREFQSRLEEETEERRRLEDIVAQAVSTRDDAEQRHAVARQDLEAKVAEVERLEKREAELTSMLADATTGRSALERRLAATEAAFKDSDDRATRERLAASKRAAEREAGLEGQIRQERATRATLEQALEEAEAALKDARERYDSALAIASDELAERQARFDRESSQAAATCASLTQQLTETETALEQVRHNHQTTAAEVERLGQREIELAAQLAEATATCRTLERELVDAAGTIEKAAERVAEERAAAAQRQANLEARLAEALDARDTLERTLTETRSTAQGAERAFREEIEALRMSARAEVERHETEIANERTDRQNRLAEVNERIQSLTRERDALQQSLTEIREQSDRLEIEHREESGRFEQALTAADADIERLTTERTQAEQNLEETRREHQDTLDRLSREHAAALTALTASVTEHGERLEEQAALHASSLRAVEHSRTELQAQFQSTLAARDRDIEQLHDKLTAAVRELEIARERQEVLKTEVDLLPRLRKQLEDSRAEIGRQFEHLPLALFQCMQDGTLVQANRACAVMIGYRRVDELRGRGFAAAVFEAPNDLSWLIDRCLNSRARESLETTWRKKSGARLAVRLSAFASAAGIIEIAAEDLTSLRVVEDKLSQAHRMEAVGRLASEVAVTCGHLLGDVYRNLQQWLMTAGSDTASRHQGEMLLDEVTRAASFLRQLSVYGEEQADAPGVVDLNAVVRDLEPVLKRVAGEGVELELHHASSSLNVDVRAEHVERLLVNLASYGRERMPFGGRLRIELNMIVVDRHYADKYPTRQRGPHALITVTQVRRAAGADGLLRLREGTFVDGLNINTTEKPGVDLGALQGHARECGGHLWMTVEPSGDMVVKIHLPLPTSYDSPHTRAALGDRARSLASLFRQ